MMGLRTSVTSTDANPTPHLLTYPGREGRRERQSPGAFCPCASGEPRLFRHVIVPDDGTGSSSSRHGPLHLSRVRQMIQLRPEGPSRLSARAPRLP